MAHDSWPDFNDDCNGCKKSAVKPPEILTFEVPICPGSIDEEPPACGVPKRFFDRLTKDFIMPALGTPTKMYVCHGDDFVACQWVAVCYQNDQSVSKTAFLKIISRTPKTLTVYNGCSGSDPIIDNPEVGSLMPTGTIIYPTPPRWCSSVFNKLIADAIANSDGRVCAAILSCLKNSDQVCFTNTPALVVGDNAEAGLFGGTIGDAATWCLRKLTKIFTGSVGKTLCFADMPTTTDDPVEGVQKHYVYLLPSGCLAKGAEIANSCPDSYLYTSGYIDRIWICSVGRVKQIVPTVVGQGLVAYDSGAGVMRWRLGGVQLQDFLCPEFTVYNGTAASINTATADLYVGTVIPPTAKWLKVIIRGLAQSSAANNIDYVVQANGRPTLYGGWNSTSGGAITSYQINQGAEFIIPVSPSGVSVINFSGSTGVGAPATNLHIFCQVTAWM